MSSKCRVGLFTTGDTMILLHEFCGDNGGREWSGVRSRLEEYNNNCFPSRVPGK